jgi:hypothetical protein
MNKRSAMLMAAGLVLTLIVGGVAMSTGLTGPTPSQAAPRAGQRQKAPKPIIKTVKHTVTVHKQGTATPATATAPATSGSSSAGSLSGSMDDDQGISSDDTQGEDQGDDDSGESGDDHGYDDHGDDHGGDDDRTAS